MNEYLRRILFLPEQRSTVAPMIDALHYYVILVTMAGATLVTLVGAYLVVRYRQRRPDVEPPNPEADVQARYELKVLALVALVLLFFSFWAIGVGQYMRVRVAPLDSMKVYVTAKRWMWKFAYPEGPRSLGVLYVPVGRPVMLVLTSRDVIHSLFVPDFRVKQDAVPGRYTTMWFQATEAGTYDILCAEYCGTGHSTMRAQMVALSPEDFARWLGGAPGGVPRPAGPEYEEPRLGRVDLPAPRVPVDLVRVGERVAAEQGCLRCHTLDGTPHIGPSWAGTYLSRVPLEGGGEVVADDAYLTESIMDPKAKIHRGFPAVMPSYLGRIDAPEVAAIVELIRSLRDVPKKPGPNVIIENGEVSP